MAKTSSAAPAAAAAPLVVYLTAPTGGRDGVPYEGPRRVEGPADQVPAGARILGPVGGDAAPASDSESDSGTDSGTDSGPVTDIDGHPVG